MATYASYKTLTTDNFQDTLLEDLITHKMELLEGQKLILNVTMGELMYLLTYQKN